MATAVEAAETVETVGAKEVAHVEEEAVRAEVETEEAVKATVASEEGMEGKTVAVMEEAVEEAADLADC